MDLVLREYLKDYFVTTYKNKDGNLIIKSQNNGVIIESTEVKIENNNIIWAKKLKKYKVLLRDYVTNEVVATYETQNLKDLIVSLFGEIQALKDYEKNKEIEELRKEFKRLRKEAEDALAKLPNCAELITIPDK